MGFFRDMFDLGKDLIDITRQARQEIREVLTDGFIEIVIKGNSNYKTSFEKREEAYQIAFTARSQYEETYKDVRRTYEQVRKLVEDHYAYKVKVYETLHSKHAPIIKQYIEELEFKKRELNAHRILDLSDINWRIGSNLYSKISTLKIGKDFLGAFGKNLLGTFLMDSFLQRKRVAEANKLLEDAKELQAELRAEIEKLKRVKTNLLFVKKTVEEERSLIERLIQPLQHKMMDTKGALKASSLKKEKIQEIENAIEILSLLERTLTTQFLQDEAKITRQYQQLSEQLRSMEVQIVKRSV